jgi:predicted nucleic acid-binding protein
LKLIDTNVFIYAVGEPHPYKEVCVQLMQGLTVAGHDATVDTEVAQEILHYFQMRRRMTQGLALLDSLLTAFPAPIPITVGEVRLAGELLRKYPQIQARDAVHAAVVLAHHLDGIISADKGFDAVAEIVRFDPHDEVN